MSPPPDPTTTTTITTTTTLRSSSSLSSLVYLGLVLGICHIMHLFHIMHINIHMDHIHIKNPPPPLRFSPTASFKILQVADLHYGSGPTTRCAHIHHHQRPHCSDLNSTAFLRRLIQAESPHFIAFTGDNIFGESAQNHPHHSLMAAFAPAVEAGIPWAAVLGNHDHESGDMERHEIMFLASLMDYSYTTLNPHNYQNNTIYGYGNYDINVLGASHNNTLLRMVFLDTGHRHTVDGRKTYGWIRDSQLEWITQSHSQSPMLMFFHIPIPELRDQLYDPQSGVTPVGGWFQESVGCSSVHSGVLSSVMKSTTAMFHGHDHLNDFCAHLSNSIWSCYGGGFGYHAYGKPGWHRRGRVIEANLHPQLGTLSSIHTWKRLDDGALTKIDPLVLWEKQHNY